jgi:hypothetical protein
MSQETKECEQCHHKKALTEFHRRKNKTDGRMRICAQCYGENLTETRRLGEERMRQWKIEEEEQERQRRQAEKQAQQAQQAEALKKSLEAHKLCPRCKAIRTDGSLWPDGHLYFRRYCQECTDNTPHMIYTLTCPKLRIVRYVGITSQSLNKRLGGHMGNDGGTEQKIHWIGTLKKAGLKPSIDLIDVASNETQAKEKELYLIYHHIQQGHPLVNAEALTPQRVLDLQRSTTDWKRATPEQMWEIVLDTSAPMFRMASQSERRLQVLQWKHRHERVYVLDNREIPLYFSSLSRVRLETERSLIRLEAYSQVTFADTLPQNRADRQSVLNQTTLAVFNFDSKRTMMPSMIEDLTYFLNKNIPILCAYYDGSEITKGTVVKLIEKNKKHLPVIHPFSYSIDAMRALICCEHSRLL